MMGGVTAAPTPRRAGARCAYTVLRRVFERGAYADQALQAEAARARRRATARWRCACAYGAVQRRGTLDHLIARLAERPAARARRAACWRRCGSASTSCCTSRGAPDYAVVADAVELAKAPRARGHGLVNAVLRRAAREGAAALLGALGDATRRAGRGQALPPGVDRAAVVGGARRRAGARADGRRQRARRGRAARQHARRRRRRARRRAAGRARTRDPAIPEALVLEEPFDVHGSPLWRDGRVHRAVARRDARRPRARAAARRARARPVRRAGRQDARTWRR